MVGAGGCRDAPRSAHREHPTDGAGSDRRCRIKNYCVIEIFSTVQVEQSPL